MTDCLTQGPANLFCKGHEAVRAVGSPSRLLRHPCRSPAAAHDTEWVRCVVSFHLQQVMARMWLVGARTVCSPLVWPVVLDWRPTDATWKSEVAQWLQRAARAEDHLFSASRGSGRRGHGSHREACLLCSRPREGAATQARACLPVLPLGRIALLGRAGFTAQTQPSPPGSPGTIMGLQDRGSHLVSG